MADNQIGILFGVEGGGDIDTGSGARIAKQLQAIANKLDGKIKFVASIDVDKTRTAILKQLQDIQSGIKLGLPEVDQKASDKAVNSFRAMSKKMSAALTELTGYNGKSFSLKNAFLSDNDLKTFQSQSAEIKAKVEQFQKAYAQLETNFGQFQGKYSVNGLFNIDKSNFAEANEIYQKFEDLKIQANFLKSVNSDIKANETSQLSYLKVLDSVTSHLQKYGETMRRNTPGSYDAMMSLQERLQAGELIGKGGVAQQEFLDIAKNARLAGGEVETLGQTIRRVFNEKLGYGILGALAIYARQGIMQVYNNVVKLDTAMTELKKVTDETDATYSKFLDNAAERAQKLGATMSDVVTASSDFARLGFNIDDASKLADAAIVYKNVGDGINDISTASESLISTLKAFDIPADDVMKIVDVYNAIGNTEATSSAGIGEALQRSASALSVAGASVEEASALAAAMNTTVQNSEKVGTTLKTASMYLRAAKTDAEDAGESTEGMAESVSQLRNELKSIAGVDIMKDDDTFKGIFQQYRELAAAWNSGKMTDVAKANVLNLLGGKRNADAISGMLNNWEVAERALQTAQNSSGSALTENEKYLDSINGKISQLKAQFEDISRKILSSDAVKWVADLLQNVLKLADGLSEIKLLLPTILALLGQATGLKIGGVDQFGKFTTFGKTRAQWKQDWADNKYSDSAIGKIWGGMFGSASGLKSNELKTLENYYNELLKIQKATDGAGTATDAYNKYLANERSYVQYLGKELESGSVSMENLKNATARASTAMTIFNAIKSIAFNMAIGWVVEGLVLGIKALIDLVPTTEKLGEKLVGINQEIASLKSENESLNNELQTTADRINELQGKGKLTLVEENELKQLRLTNAQLEAKLALNEALYKQKQKEQQKTAKEWINSQDQEYSSGNIGGISAGNTAYSGYVAHYNKKIIDENGAKAKSSNSHEYIVNEYALLEYYQEEYNKAANDGNKKRAESMQKNIDDVSNRLQDLYNDWTEKVDGLEYVDADKLGRALTPDEEKINEILDTYNVFSARITAQSGNIAGAFAQISAIPRFEKLKQQLTELGDSGQLTAEKMGELWNSSEEFQQFIQLLNQAGLIQWKDILGDKFKDLDTSNDGLVSYDEITVYATNHSEDFTKALSGVGNQFTTLSKKTDDATNKMSSYLEGVKSVTNKLTEISGKKDTIADMMAELRGDGSLSAESMSKLFNDFSNVEGFEDYIRVLTSGNASAKQMQGALNGLYGAFIDSKDIIGDVTEENLDYVTAQLKALGVTNATDVATVGLAASLTQAAMSKGTLNEATVQSIKNQMLEKGASQSVANSYVSAANACIQAQNNMSQALTTQVKTRIQNMGIELSAVKSVGDAYNEMWRVANLKNKEAVLRGQKSGRTEEDIERSILGDEIYNAMMAAGAAGDALAKIKNLQKQVSGGSSYKISVPPTSKNSSGSSEDANKKKFEEEYSKLKWRRDNNLINENQYLKALDALYKKHFNNRSKYLDEYAQYSQEVFEGFKQMYIKDMQNKLNAEKESLEKQKDNLKELADARKKALEDAKDEEDYKKDQAEKRAEINKIESLLAQFSGKLDLSAQKKVRELQSQLKEKQDELNDFENDKALERAKEQIDKDYENQEKAINSKIDKIEKQLDDLNKNEDLPVIRSAVVGFAKKYGIAITKPYAKGTPSVPAITQENGAEVIAGNISRGQFTMLTPTSKVWNASATQALWDFANSPEAYLGPLIDDISTFKQQASAMIYSQPVNVNVGGITVNGNADNQTVQKIKRSQKEQIEDILKAFKKMQ